VIQLDDTEAHHAIHVLRLQAGDSVEVFDGRGGLGYGVVARIARKTVAVEVSNVNKSKPRQGGRVIIATSIAKGQRFDWLVGKCTELGADHIACVLFERTVKQAKGTAVQRYRKMTISAAKQCGRLFLPEISGPGNLAESVVALKEHYPEAVVLFGDFGDDSIGIGEVKKDGRDVIALVGPEGGMAESEEQLLKEHGAVGVRLSENVLRIETAAVAFAAILCADR
jgi:16S rRNA (uracil1498-N3)-methyltransferase